MAVSHERGAWAQATVDAAMGACPCDCKHGTYGGLYAPGCERNPGLAGQDKNPFTGSDAPKG